MPLSQGALSFKRQWRDSGLQRELDIVHKSLRIWSRDEDTLTKVAFIWNLAENTQATASQNVVFQMPNQAMARTSTTKTWRQNGYFLFPHFSLFRKILLANQKTMMSNVVMYRQKVEKCQSKLISFRCDPITKQTQTIEAYWEYLRFDGSFLHSFINPFNRKPQGHETKQSERTFSTLILHPKYRHLHILSVDVFRRELLLTTCKFA